MAVFHLCSVSAGSEYLDLPYLEDEETEYRACFIECSPQSHMLLSEMGNHV